ncbi:MAG: ATP synthase F0 subunit B [Acidobacteriaceae bacterium]
MKRSRWALQMLFILSLVVSAAPRHAEAQSTSASQQRANQTLVEESNRAAKNKEALKEEQKEAPDENAAFRYSKSVTWFSNHTGMNVKTGYWVFTSINFVIIAWLLIWGWAKFWPSFVRGRNQRIIHALEEARHTSAEAQRRLSGIELRLAKLDSEIAAMKDRANVEGEAEEVRMKAASAEEKQRILQAAEQEIASASAQARRDLKTFAAGIAVDLAQTRIASRIDADSDEQLVREFAQRLGQEGHA